MVLLSLHFLFSLPNVDSGLANWRAGEIGKRTRKVLCLPRKSRSRGLKLLESYSPALSLIQGTSPAISKFLYENERSKVSWDVPLYAENTKVRTNRINTKLVDKVIRRNLIELS